jgi:hypothetical protein
LPSCGPCRQHSMPPSCGPCRHHAALAAVKRSLLDVMPLQPLQLVYSSAKVKLPLPSGPCRNNLHIYTVLLHNGGFCNDCITKRCLHLMVHYTRIPSYMAHVSQVWHDK